jgi:hypothetical protein
MACLAYRHARLMVDPWARRPTKGGPGCCAAVQSQTLPFPGLRMGRVTICQHRKAKLPENEYVETIGKGHPSSAGILLSGVHVGPRDRASRWSTKLPRPYYYAVSRFQVNSHTAAPRSRQYFIPTYTYRILQNSKSHHKLYNSTWRPAAVCFVSDTV